MTPGAGVPAGEEDPGAPSIPRITRLEAQQRDPARLNVFIDGAYAFALDGEVVAEVGLGVGIALTDELRAGLETAEHRRQARARALRFLGYRERSRAEVAQRLRQSDYAPELVAEVCDWLESLGYIDDERYAAAFSRQKRAAGWGARRIAGELQRRGVGRVLALEAAVSPGEEAAGLDDVAGSAGGVSAADDLLIGLVSRRFGARLAAGDAGAERRAAAFLARRGHDWQSIRRVLAAVEQAEVEGVPDEAVSGASLTLSAQRGYTLMVCDERSRRVLRPYS